VFVAGFIGAPGMSFAPAASLGLEPAGATVGVRPEHARPWAEGAGLAGPLNGTVEYVEALGRETFLGVRHDEVRLVLCVEGRSDARPGDAVAYGLATEGLRFFDPESGLALAGASPGTLATS
jgi:ABC-type sugar transport system ATPase subunit